MTALAAEESSRSILKEYSSRGGSPGKALPWGGEDKRRNYLEAES